MNIKTDKISRAIIFAGVLITYFVLAYFFAHPLFNNGDYLRVTHNLISIPPYYDLTTACFKVTPSFYFPLSLSALVMQLSLALSLLLGQACWTLNAHFLLLSFIYILGAVLYAKDQFSKLSILFTLLLSPIFFSVFFKSLYEEGVLLALMPWLILSLNSYFKNGKVLGMIICFSLLLLTKHQLVLLAPAILFFVIKYAQKGRASFFKIGAVIIVLIFSAWISTYNRQSTGAGIANSYNRLFNGIGWSMQGISDWPANQYSEREHYFANNRPSLQTQSNSLELIENEYLWGTSFWPKGLELMTSGNDARWQSIEKLLTPKKMAAFFWAHPRKLSTYLFNSTMVFLGSDYTLRYLQIPNLYGSYALFTKIGNTLRKAVIVFYLSGLILFLCSRKGAGRMIGAFTMFCAPLSVILGDGFFEFEKHMMPYFISLPLLFILFPRATPPIVSPFRKKLIC